MQAHDGACTERRNEGKALGQLAVTLENQGRVAGHVVAPGLCGRRLQEGSIRTMLL
jgi:hypothetical protein